MMIYMDDKIAYYVLNTTFKKSPKFCVIHIANLYELRTIH